MKLFWGFLLNIRVFFLCFLSCKENINLDLSSTLGWIATMLFNAFQALYDVVCNSFDRQAPMNDSRRTYGTGTVGTHPFGIRYTTSFIVHLLMAIDICTVSGIWAIRWRVMQRFESISFFQCSTSLYCNACSIKCTCLQTVPLGSTWNSRYLLEAPKNSKKGYAGLVAMYSLYFRLNKGPFIHCEGVDVTCISAVEYFY